jgi:Ca-activated chloride channel family protein
MEIPATPKGSALVAVDGRTYPLESARIEAEASGGIVLSKLVQSYRNPYAEALEVVYTMPLPADGAVIAYTMRLGERVICGEVRPREQARADYARAIFEGRQASLLEQQRDDTFTQSLGSLPAGVTAEITIEVLHPLMFLAGSGDAGSEWEYRFPTVVSVRYEGTTGRVPDADRLDVDRGDPGAIPARIEVTLNATDTTGTVARRVEAMPLDRDIVVRWPAGSPGVGVQLVEGPGLPGDDGRYALLTITPPSAPDVGFARDLTILIDASGSMEGPPLEWAKSVAAAVLRSLSAGDLFEVIAFATRPRSLTGGAVRASSENVSTAIGEIGALTAHGGTEMVDAVIEALRPLRAESLRQVVLITDGQIGFEDEVVRRIREGLPLASRLHVVGVGAAPNRTLTSRAARAGRGVETFVCGAGDLGVAAGRAVAATARPILTDLRVLSTMVQGIVPARPRDVMAGQPVVLGLELADEEGTIDVSANLAGTSRRWSWSVHIPARHERSAVSSLPLGAFYGRELIADVEISGRAAAGRVGQIAMRHRIASRETSLVAIADEPSTDPWLPRRRVELAVEVPAFQSAEGLGLLGSGVRSRYRRFDQLQMEASSSLSDADFLCAPLASRRPQRHVVPGRVVAIEDELLIIEYESPAENFETPTNQVMLFAGDEAIDLAVVVRRQSSPGKRHGKGLILRLAVRRKGGWSAGEHLTLRWEGDVEISITVSVEA